MHQILMPFKYVDACSARNAFLFKIKIKFFLKRAVYLEQKRRHTPTGKAVSGTIAIYREALRILEGHGGFWAGKGRKGKDGSADMRTKLRVLAR